MLARYDKGLRVFMLNPVEIIANFLRRLLKICIQIKWMCQLKRDSLASLVHDNLFHHSIVTTTRCVVVCWSYRYFWKISPTIIKDLNTNKVNYAKQKYKNIDRQTKSKICWPCKHICNKLSQKQWNTFISFAQLNKKKIYIYSMQSPIK